MFNFIFCILSVTVACTNGDVRLMNGSDHSSTLGVGRVEICYNNSYWAVCDDQWDILDAGVVCQQLGTLSSSNTDFCDQLYIMNFVSTISILSCSSC